MKRILIALVIVIFLLCGCCIEEAEETQQRFVIEYQQTFNAWANITIIRDTETGNAYLYARSGYSAAITILEEGEA